MNSVEWFKRVDESTQQSYSKSDVKQILGNITPGYILYSPDKLLFGDVFRYKLVGGKVRPWVTLWVRKGLVGAATLTHDENLVGSFPCECRFYKGSYIGPTLTVIEVGRVIEASIAPYSNKKHLREVFKEIRKRWG
jgi:hypothetical protein